MITNIIVGIVVLYTMILQYKYYNIKMKKEVLEEKFVESAIYIVLLERVYEIDDKVKEELKRCVNNGKDSIIEWWKEDTRLK